jgi:hypothetical protein
MEMFKTTWSLSWNMFSALDNGPWEAVGAVLGCKLMDLASSQYVSKLALGRDSVTSLRTLICRLYMKPYDDACMKPDDDACASSMHLKEWLILMAESLPCHNYLGGGVLW